MARGLLTPRSMSQFHVPNIMGQELRHRYAQVQSHLKASEINLKKKERVDKTSDVQEMKLQGRLFAGRQYNLNRKTQLHS